MTLRAVECDRHRATPTPGGTDLYFSEGYLFFGETKRYVVFVPVDGSLMRDIYERRLRLIITVDCPCSGSSLIQEGDAVCFL